MTEKLRKIHHLLVKAGFSGCANLKGVWIEYKKKRCTKYFQSINECQRWLGKNYKQLLKIKLKEAPYEQKSGT